MNKILIIEDDQIVANIYRNKFSLEGFQVEVATDGDAGLELVRSFRPDAILLDLMLPKLTGVELMKQIRSEPNFAKLPVIVFSNTYLTNMVQDAWKAGATKCLSKSNCTPQQVLQVIRGELSTNGAGKETATAQPSPSAPASQVQAQEQKPAAPSALDSDAEFQNELRRSLVESFPAMLGALRALLQSIIKTDNEPARVKQLQELYRRVHALTGNAGIVGMLQVAQMADALEALLKELYEKPKNITASTLRTVASAIDFLGVLFDRTNLTEPQEFSPPNILVVDDEAISRRAITYALEKARLKPTNVEDPLAALKLLEETPFDLVFLDVDMPGMNGFELCSKLRSKPANKKTPVIFVTSLTDFDSRASSSMSGGSDFIAKPFLFIELAVKALVYIMRGRLTQSKQKVA